MMPDQKANLRDAAVKAWAELAGQSGLDPSAFGLQFLSVRREGAGGGRVAALLTAGKTRYVLKMRVGGAADRFDRTVRAHRMAADAMRGMKGLNTPEVLAACARHQAILISYCGSRTVWDVLAETNRVADHVVTLSAAGRWTSAFHRALARDTAPFSPDDTLNALKRFSQTRTYPDPARFEQAMAHVQDLGRGLLGTPVPQAVIHGDLTLSNLLISDDNVAGIDFENDRPAPVARDLAMTLADYAVWFGQQDQTVAGQVLSPAKHRAFWSGYGDMTGDDGILAFYLGVRLLRIWAAVPADPMRRTVRRAHVWAGVSSVAGRVLDAGG